MDRIDWNPKEILPWYIKILLSFKRNIFSFDPVGLGKCSYVKAKTLFGEIYILEIGQITIPSQTQGIIQKEKQ